MSDFNVIVIGAGGGVPTTIASGCIASNLIEKYEQ
jgi:hypothetical protein